MENIHTNLENGILTIFLQGHIDSTNAADVETQIVNARAAAANTHTIFDAKDLQYISSAGLRIILRVRKEDPELKIINVSPEVYEILDMTGFTEMMPVQKAYRVISVEGCEVIGQGANGKVYRIDPDTIVKVYLNPDALPEIQRERELARSAFVLGVPTAIPYDVVRVGDGYGSVFELLNAKSLAKMLAADPGSIDEIVHRSIDLLKLIHGTLVKPGVMPDMREVALNWAEFLKGRLEPELQEKLYNLIAAVPQDQHMMHGDYHLKNVMVQNGENLLIDMDTLCVGHPVFELASMYNAYCGFAELNHNVAMEFLGIPYETSVEFWNRSLRLYLDGMDESAVKAVEEKAMVVGYTRLLRRTIRRNPDATEQIEFYRGRLAELVPKVDSLTF